MITDRVENVQVEYAGLLPAHFRHGPGVVAGGRSTADGASDAPTGLARNAARARRTACGRGLPGSVGRRVGGGDALAGASVPLARGRLTGLWLDRAKAERLNTGGRQITLRFRARVDDV